MSGDDKSQPTTKLLTGMLILLMAVGGLVGLICSASDSITPGATPSGLWWGPVALFGAFLLTGVVWVVTGIRALFLPTSLIYRMTDLPSWFERFPRVH
jgi:hypothetical protein